MQNKSTTVLELTVFSSTGYNYSYKVSSKHYLQNVQENLIGETHIIIKHLTIGFLIIFVLLEVCHMN